jgi:glycosyltransferase involved in cell wall biosynthesis
MGGGVRYGVCAIVPALNCSGTIGEVVAGTRRHIPLVLVIDDGSNDETAAEAEHAGAVVLRHPVNRGKGASLMTGFRRAHAEGCRQAVTLDGDGQHDPSDIPGFVRSGERFPDRLILGARDLARPGVPFSSRLGNRVANVFVNLSARQGLADTQCGFRLYPLGPILALPLLGTGYEFESEVIVRASRRGIRFHTLAISTHYPPGRSRSSQFRLRGDTWRIFRCVLRSFFWR